MISSHRYPSRVCFPPDGVIPHPLVFAENLGTFSTECRNFILQSLPGGACRRGNKARSFLR